MCIVLVEIVWRLTKRGILGYQHDIYATFCTMTCQFISTYLRGVPSKVRRRAGKLAQRVKSTECMSVNQNAHEKSKLCTYSRECYTLTNSNKVAHALRLPKSTHLAV